MKAIGGTAYLKIDGDQKTLAGSWSVSPTATIKTGVVGLSGVAGYTDAARIPYMEGSLIDNGNLSIADLEAITSATITLELVNGKTYVGYEMFLAGEPSHDASNGEVSVRFEGKKIEEMS
jgi:hypothetical protein